MSKICNCIEEVQNSLRDNLKSKGKYRAIGFLLINATFPIADKPQKVVLEARFSAGINSKLGKEKVIEDKINVIASFCPFCGQKYEA